MPSSFAVTAATNSVQLNNNRSGQASFTVFNGSGRPTRGRATIVPQHGETDDWYSLNGDLERDFEIAGTSQYTVQVSVPNNAEAGTYSFRMNMVGVDNPDEDFTEGPIVTYEVPEPEEKKPFPWKIPAIIAAVVLVVIIAAVGFVLTRGSDAPSQVPEVAASSVPDATTMLHDAGLTVSDETIEVFSDDVAQGLVLGTDPPVGSDVDEGGTVTLLVSGGPEPTPTVMPTSTAVPVAADPTATAVPSSTQTPAPTATATATTVVDNSIVVPDLAGLTIIQATQSLTTAGFTVANNTLNAPSSTIDQGLVVGTNPAVGTQLEPRTEVSLVLSSGLPVVVEVGQVAAFADEGVTVELNNTFDNPVVIVQPPSRNGTDTTVVRITDVQPDSFSIYIHDAPNFDPNHTNETASYIVIEAGAWELPDGSGVLEAGTISTSDTVGANLTNRWANVSFHGEFSNTPVIFSQVQTNQDTHWVKTRQNSLSPDGFQVALEEEESRSISHGIETIGWLAISSGVGEWDGFPYEANYTDNAVTEIDYAITFNQTFDEVPRFIASLATYNGSDNAYLRYFADTITAQSVSVYAEEDTTFDEETAHSSEVVSYFVIEAEAVLTGRELSQ